MIKCCKECEMRTPTCHCTCERYKVESAENEKRLEAEAVERETTRYNFNRPTMKSKLYEPKYKGNYN